MKDRLYLLKPNFRDDEGGPYFCAACAMVEGMLSFFPELRQKIDVHYVDYERPRPKIVAEIGEANQSAPVLVLGDASPEPPELVDVKTGKGRRFIDNEYGICHYLAKSFGLADPHGDLHTLAAPAA